MNKQHSKYYTGDNARFGSFVLMFLCLFIGGLFILALQVAWLDIIGIILLLFGIFYSYVGLNEYDPNLNLKLVKFACIIGHWYNSVFRHDE